MVLHPIALTSVATNGRMNEDDEKNEEPDAHDAATAWWVRRDAGPFPAPRRAPSRPGSRPIRLMRGL